MTVHISLKAVAFVVYTLALLGGAFGISYAVFEWRHDDEAAVTSSAPVETGPSQAELDAQKCEAALKAAGESVSGDRATGNSRTITLSPRVPKIIQDTINRYCK